MEITIIILCWCLICYIYNKYTEDNCKKKKKQRAHKETVKKTKRKTYKIKQTKTKENTIASQQINWSELRQIVLEKYHYHCSICGCNEEIDVHHKIPIKDGGTNEIENLIAVCRTCHEELHHFKLSTVRVTPSDKYGKDIKRRHKFKKGYILLQAISKKYKLKIQYKTHNYNSSVETNERIIRPIQLKYGYEIDDNEYISNSKYDKNKLFIYAFCELRQEMRLFRFDRLEIISVIK